MYRACRTAEADIGMAFYLSDTEGTGGRLKISPEDFIVDEISIDPPAKDGGRYTIATVKSTNWETNRLVRILSRSLGISRDRIGFAGTKDKRAVTTQLMSFGCPPDALSRIDLKDLVISNTYQASRPLKIGDLVGNRFAIRVRECTSTPDDIRERTASVRTAISDAGGFPNYFGVQRFGVSRPITHRVGEMIVRGDLKKAVDIYLSAPSEHETADVSLARKALAECGGDYADIIPDMPKTMSFEKTIAEHLTGNPGDYAGAIGSMPTNLQMMLTHAYQSYIFNMMLSGRMSHGLPLDAPVEGDVVIPLDANGVPDHEKPVIATSKNLDLVTRQVRSRRACITLSLFGSDSVIPDGEMGDIERTVIDFEGVRPDDFIIPGLPHCTSRGGWREILCPVGDLRSETKDDGYEVSFSLTKGNYATCLMREFMKSDMIMY